MKRDLDPEIDAQLEAALVAYADRLRAATPMALMPSPETLLWKAALRARLGEAERALRWGDQVRRGVFAAGALGLVVAGALFRRPLLDFFSSLAGAGTATAGAPLDLTLATIALLSAAGLVVWLLEGSTNRS